jgi:hypothetical protein
MVRMILPWSATRTRQLSRTGQFGQSNSYAWLAAPQGLDLRIHPDFATRCGFSWRRTGAEPGLNLMSMVGFRNMARKYRSGTPVIGLIGGVNKLSGRGESPFLGTVEIVGHGGAFATDVGVCRDGRVVKKCRL